jgi:ABC-type uncharacterized transport system substrate-binding protein
MRRARITALAAIALAFLAAPLAAEVQQAGKVHRVGVLWPGSFPPDPLRMEWFRQSLRESGYLGDQNLTIELRYARGGGNGLSELVADLIQLRVDVIATFGDVATRVVQQTTTTVPIVPSTSWRRTS